MKKIITTLTLAGLILGFNSNVSAGEIDTKKLKFGAFVAPTLTWMKPTANKSDDNVFLTSNEGTKFGFTYGLMAEYQFANNYSFATGLQINASGGKINTMRDAYSDVDSASGFVNTTAFDYNLQYLEIPLSLKMRTNLISGVRFFGQLGITPGFNIGKKVTYNITGYNGTSNYDLSDENVKLKGALTISPIIFQMNIGAGVEYPISDQFSAYAGIFFNNGFAPDVTNTKKYDFGQHGDFKDGNVRLNNFSLRLGLFF